MSRRIGDGQQRAASVDIAVIAPFLQRPPCRSLPHGGGHVLPTVLCTQSTKETSSPTQHSDIGQSIHPDRSTTPEPTSYHSHIIGRS